MKYEPRDIRQIKLVTGEEILAEIVGEDMSEFLIRNPLKVHKEKVVVGGHAREVNMFTRWMSLAENDMFAIQKYHIMIEAIVNDAVAAYYNNMMDTIEDEVTVGRMSDMEEDDAEPTSSMLEQEEDDKPTFH